jgi:hypothetical protein
MNFKDQAMIERMINNSNVVINLVGPRKYLKRREEFDYVISKSRRESLMLVRRKACID